MTNPKRLLVPAAWCALVVGSWLALAADGPPPPQSRKAALPLKMSSSLPLDIPSSGVEWRGQTYHLLNLRSIQFNLDKNAHLKATIQAGVTTFDDVEYDISAAVFDAAGELLGAARTQCKIERIWLGRTMNSSRSLDLDFGVSLDYPHATAFMVSVSKQKVLTPDAWQK